MLGEFTKQKRCMWLTKGRRQPVSWMTSEKKQRSSLCESIGHYRDLAFMRREIRIPDSFEQSNDLSYILSG
jgi:hypothetical protein